MFCDFTVSLKSSKYRFHSTSNYYYSYCYYDSKSRSSACLKLFLRWVPLLKENFEGKEYISYTSSYSLCIATAVHVTSISLRPLASKHFLLNQHSPNLAIIVVHTPIKSPCTGRSCIAIIVVIDCLRVWIKLCSYGYNYEN